MSSTLRRTSQIPVREKFFRAIAAVSSANALVSDPAPTVAYTSVMPASGTGAYTGAFDAYGSTTAAGALFRDMGRELILTAPDANNVSVHTHLYRNLQLVGSSTTEGVAGTSAITGPDPYQGDFWVLVWAADGTVPPVVRVG